MFSLYRRLRDKGVLGLNERNVAFISGFNDRCNFPLVDNKLLTKEAAQRANIAVPLLLGVVRSPSELHRVENMLEPLQQFVVKPARGSGGKGIIVITGREGDRFIKPSGEMLDFSQLRRDISNILGGVYSLGGRPDVAFLETLVAFDPNLQRYSHEGLPDIRVVVFRGYPIMAMLRCPTHLSDGKANLHQGAVGVGLDIARGTVLRAIQQTRIIEHHPDTGVPFNDLAIPVWRQLLELAASCYELTGLGYMGCDIVLDRYRGPLILELNVRPGLAIQLASGIGLRHRLNHIRALEHAEESPAARVDYILANFS